MPRFKWRFKSLNVAQSFSFAIVLYSSLFSLTLESDYKTIHMRQELPVFTAPMHTQSSLLDPSLYSFCAASFALTIASSCSLLAGAGILDSSNTLAMVGLFFILSIQSNVTGNSVMSKILKKLTTICCQPRNARSAYEHLLPTSHGPSAPFSCLERCFSNTPVTRLISFW